MIDPKKPMARINIPYKFQDMVLNADDAFALFKIMCNAEPIEYDYGSKGYKYIATNDRPTLTAFTVTDYAQLALNTEPE
jgi:hypothetical protein